MAAKTKIPVFKLLGIMFVFWASFMVYTIVHTLRVNASIRYVMLADHQIAKQLEDEVAKLNLTNDDGLDALVEDINNRVAVEKRIPMKGCPTDFAKAYNQYLDAMEDFANVLASHPHVEGNMENFTINFLRGMACDFSGPERDQKEWADWQAKVNVSISEAQQAENEFEAKAAQYGVR